MTDSTCLTKKSAFEKHQEALDVNSIEIDNWKQTADEWDAVATVVPGFMSGDQSKNATRAQVESSHVSYNTALVYLKSQDFSHVKNKIQPTIKRSKLRELTYRLLGPPKLNSNLVEERDFIFLIAHTSLDNEQGTHVDMLLTIYRLLTGAKINCPRYGNHWEQIGFQGQDPATDLRGAGMLGLLQPLCLLTNPDSLSIMKQVYKLSLDETQNFPFMVLSINMTGMVLKLLREERLNRMCNKRKQVLAVCNEVYAALLLYLHDVWKREKKTIANCGNVLRDAEKFASKRTPVLMRNLCGYLERNRRRSVERSSIPNEVTSSIAPDLLTDIAAMPGRTSDGDDDADIKLGQAYRV